MIRYDFHTLRFVSGSRSNTCQITRLSPQADWSPCKVRWILIGYQCFYCSSNCSESDPNDIVLHNFYNVVVVVVLVDGPGPSEDGFLHVRTLLDEDVVFQTRWLVRCWAPWRPSPFHTQPSTQPCGRPGWVPLCLVMMRWTCVESCLSDPTVCRPLAVSSQEAASLSIEAGLGGGRSLLQARGGYRERQRERERQRRIKEKAEIYGPVEFKVEQLSYFFLYIHLSLAINEKCAVLYILLIVNKSYLKDQNRLLISQ